MTQKTCTIDNCTMSEEQHKAIRKVARAEAGKHTEEWCATRKAPVKAKPAHFTLATAPMTIKSVSGLSLRILENAA